MDLLGEYNVSATFNVVDLSLFDYADSRVNPFQKRGYDGDMAKQHGVVKQARNPFHVLVGPITRSRAKKMQQALNGLIEERGNKTKILEANWVMEASKREVHLIETQVQEEEARTQGPKVLNE